MRLVVADRGGHVAVAMWDFAFIAQGGFAVRGSVQNRSIATIIGDSPVRDAGIQQSATGALRAGRSSRNLAIVGCYGAAIA